MSRENSSFGNSELGESLGCAIVILAILLGTGGCVFLLELADVIKERWAPETNIVAQPR